MQPSPSKNLLQISDLSKVFTIRRGLSSIKFQAVDHASLTIQAEKPEIFTLAGESGSGKTTLARMVLGLQDPSDGHIYYKGVDITGISRKQRRDWFMREVQPIFQDPFATFSPLKKVDTYLFETAKHYGAKSSDRGRNLVDQTLTSVGLSLREVAGRYPNELSGGQIQRISVARALLTAPSLLVADEPVSMVDASLRMSIVNLFKTLKEERNLSVLYITHDLATAYYLADRIAVMLRGWIVESGPVERVLGNPLHPYTQLLKGSIPLADPDRRWDEKADLAPMDIEEYTRAGCRFADRCPHVMDICRRQVPPDYEVEGRTVKCFLYDPAGAGVPVPSQAALDSGAIHHA
ncbi:MAG: peptide ABC transporter ATP-binding protein [Chloroflexi bacterium]|nr:MAG: peptide ABC transporter ATP-binding protein [Chloroflexota bacterium]